MGLLVYYDEIVFLSRHLCPEDMRELDYVSFLTDRDDFSRKFQEVKNTLPEELSSAPLTDRPRPISAFADAISKVTGQPRVMEGDKVVFAADNHTRNFPIVRDIVIHANSADFRCLYMDWETISRFNLESCDQVYNSINANYYSGICHKVSKNQSAAITHELLARKLPNYLSPGGPYHECMEELRSHPFLVDLRQYLDEVVSEGRAEEISKSALEVERLAMHYRDTTFRKYLQGRREHWSVAITAITDLIGCVVPGTGLITKVIEAHFSQRKIREIRWAGFLADLQAWPRTQNKPRGSDTIGRTH